MYGPILGLFKKKKKSNGEWRENFVKEPYLKKQFCELYA